MISEIGGAVRSCLVGFAVAATSVMQLLKANKSNLLVPSTMSDSATLVISHNV